MDCDLGHSPKYFPEFFKLSDKYDVVIGSRHKGTEGTKGWGWFRKGLTKAGYLATSLLLNMPYDSTIAFRLYRLDRIPKKLFDLVRSRGYSFFFESLYIIKFNGYKIAEFPIHMPTRIYGKSKMTLKEIFNSFKQLFVILHRTIFEKKSLTCT
jgi:dolichol-phosphate mannosyltransferase